MLEKRSDRMLIYDRVDKRRKHIKAACILLTIVILIAAAIGVGYLTYRHHAGPVLGQRTEICYYGHKKLASFSTAGMSEKAVANKIYLTKQKIDWHHPIKLRRYKYYFPKDMPKYTRHYVLKHKGALQQ